MKPHVPRAITRFHQLVPSFDGENELNGCPKIWMVVQFQRIGWRRKIFARCEDAGGGARAMRRLATTGNKPHSPPVKFLEQVHLNHKAKL